MAISDSSYQILADQVYNVEPSKAKSNNEPIIIKGSILTDERNLE